MNDAVKICAKEKIIMKTGSKYKLEVDSPNTEMYKVPETDITVRFDTSNISDGDIDDFVNECRTVQVELSTNKDGSFIPKTSFTVDGYEAWNEEMTDSYYTQVDNIIERLMDEHGSKSRKSTKPVTLQQGETDKPAGTAQSSMPQRNMIFNGSYEDAQRAVHGLAQKLEAMNEGQLKEFINGHISKSQGDALKNGNMNLVFNGVPITISASSCLVRATHESTRKEYSMAVRPFLYDCSKMFGKIFNEVMIERGYLRKQPKSADYVDVNGQRINIKELCFYLSEGGFLGLPKHKETRLFCNVGKNSYCFKVKNKRIHVNYMLQGGKDIDDATLERNIGDFTDIKEAVRGLIKDVSTHSIVLNTQCGMKDYNEIARGKMTDKCLSIALEPYDSFEGKSFNGKAGISTYDGSSFTLSSCEMSIMRFSKDRGFERMSLKWDKTTARHVNAFRRIFGKVDKFTHEDFIALQMV